MKFSMSRSHSARNGEGEVMKRLSDEKEGTHQENSISLYMSLQSLNFFQNCRIEEDRFGGEITFSKMRRLSVSIQEIRQKSH